MNVSEIPMAELLPHDEPMVLLDRCTEVLPNGARCEVEIRDTDMFASAQGVPSYVAIEYMAQTIGAYDGWRRYLKKTAPRIGYLVGTKQLQLNCDYFQVGQRLITEAVVSWDGEQLLQFKCSVADGNTSEVLVTSVVNVYSPDRQSTEE